MGGAWGGQQDKLGAGNADPNFGTRVVQVIGLNG